MIKKRRLDLGLGQTEAAEIVGCSQATVTNWEKDHFTPQINHMAGVVKFLGFNPLPDGDTVARRLVNQGGGLYRFAKAGELSQTKHNRTGALYGPPLQIITLDDDL